MVTRAADFVMRGWRTAHANLTQFWHVLKSSPELSETHQCCILPHERLNDSPRGLEHPRGLHKQDLRAKVGRNSVA
mgnify:CR=1 FL=1